MSANAVASIQSDVQRFYTYMFDNAVDAARSTGDPRWETLTAHHLRLWPPQDRQRRDRSMRELSWIATKDVSRMVALLDVLTAPATTPVTVALPGLEHPVVARGLGDPQAARVWLLQALTGRRASEILMADHDPIVHLPGINADDTDESSFVARFRYQQTKVEDVDPTILVEQAVVNIVVEQQQWVAEQHRDITGPRHLFPALRGNHQGLRARTYRSYQDSLKRLDQVVNLADSAGQPLKFTQTHRLRHTRATELLNTGVPVHVVQRYLGHKSPEMTMRYAATLAATAEAEFLRFKKIGADGRDLAIAPRDLLDLAQLDQRADRILPNGLCLLPPTQTCDKGNACLPCGSFATDASHLPEHQTQRDRLASLIEVRTAQFKAKHGTDMPEGNIWLAGRQRELASLDAILTRLAQPDVENDTVQAPGTGHAAPVAVQLVADTTHASGLHQQVAQRLTSSMPLEDNR